MRNIHIKVKVSRVLMLSESYNKDDIQFVVEGFSDLGWIGSGRGVKLAEAVEAFQGFLIEQGFNADEIHLHFKEE